MVWYLFIFCTWLIQPLILLVEVREASLMDRRDNLPSYVQICVERDRKGAGGMMGWVEGRFTDTGWARHEESNEEFDLLSLLSYTFKLNPVTFHSDLLVTKKALCLETDNWVHLQLAELINLYKCCYLYMLPPLTSSGWTMCLIDKKCHPFMTALICQGLCQLYDLSG